MWTRLSSTSFRSAPRATGERRQKRPARSWRKPCVANIPMPGQRWTRSTTAWRPRAKPSATVRTCCVRTVTVERDRCGCQRRNASADLEGGKMNFYALFYYVVDDFVSRRAAFREEHLRLAREAHRRGELVLAG